ncbi:MAG TPA: CBS domain-containing protein [Acidimicrobiia bacterium]|nr:CBS domain-containing protein [Acidimicrobiia bacterium]
MRVSELIGGPVYSCTAETGTRAAAKRMIADDVGSLAVVTDHSLVGIVTERDIVREFASGASGKRTVGDIMTPNPDSLAPDIEVDEAANWMMGAGYRHLPVVDGDELVGMVSIKDVLWALTGGN